MLAEGSTESVENPLVSVLIPCFNAERFVGEAIESALSQTWRNIEVIVVDDGSTDRSVEILRSFGERIRFSAGANRGACSARNQAFQMSSGEFIQYLDADDALLPQKIERQLPMLIDGSADVVFCRGLIFGDGKPERPKKRPILDLNGIDPFIYCLAQGMATLGPLIRRSLIHRVGGFREGLRRGQERDFHLRLAAADMRLRFLDESLYRVRHDDRPQRITRNTYTSEECLRDHLVLLNQLLTEPAYNFTDIRRRAFANTLMSTAIAAFRGGAGQLGLDGIQAACDLSPTPGYPGGILLRVLAASCGIPTAERFRYFCRSLLSRFTAKSAER